MSTMRCPSQRSLTTRATPGLAAGQGPHGLLPPDGDGFGVAALLTEAVLAEAVTTPAAVSPAEAAAVPADAAGGPESPADQA
ncbi:hypothetical protein GCM10010517_33300 [Streptosporangium fragile]|uniref:Uncharacterized protein n=1 Tax=Streptosporangium fragile TaxID=46186 RepID=A0ABN3VX03_9ACTN